MAKSLVVFITSLIVLVFVAGCPPIESEPEPVADFRLTIDDFESKIEDQKSKIESAEPEPNDVEPARVEPDEVAVAEPEPDEIEPTSVEPNDLKIKPTVSFHDKCADVLKTFVDDKGMVDYKTLRRKRLNLKALLDEFDKLDPNVYSSWPK